MVWKRHLVSDPSVKDGQLCAQGTSVTVSEMLNDLSEGAGAEQILERHPGLKLIHLAAALAYAADLASSKHCYKCVADDLEKPKRTKKPKAVKAE